MQYITITLLASLALAQQSAFCQGFSGVAAADGKQGTDGKVFCSSTIQGLLPDVNNMVSTIITSPATGSSVSGAQGFQIQFTTTKLASGLLKDVNTQFLQIPQTLEPATGMIQGASSVSVQQLTSTTKAPAAQQVSFHTVSNSAADAAGTTNHIVQVDGNSIETKGLHRVCTLALSVSGAPVIMPVAQR